MSQRIDTVSRTIYASPEKLYSAFLTPDEFVQWFPPENMKGKIHSWTPEQGKGYEMSLIYTDGSLQGKTTETMDTFLGTFLLLEENSCVKQSIHFKSENEEYQEPMYQTWLFKHQHNHTFVSVECTNIPNDISQETHEYALSQTLENLAHFCE